MNKKLLEATLLGVVLGWVIFSAMYNVTSFKSFSYGVAVCFAVYWAYRELRRVINENPAHP